jgi:hypothetical protein
VILRAPTQDPLAFAAEVLRRRRGVLWFGLLLGVASAAGWNWFQPDIYQSRAVLQLDEQQIQTEDAWAEGTWRLIHEWDARRAGKPPPPMTY